MSLEIERIINTPVDSNCYIIFDKKKNGECIIVDPGSQSSESLIIELKKLQLTPKYIILTHEHFDHCWGVNNLQDIFSETKLICSSTCSEAIQKERSNYSRYYCFPGFNIKPADILLEDINWHLEWNDYKLLFIPAKGHSSSGIFVFIEKIIFTGDTVIKDFKTTTKFKTGSQLELKESLKCLELYKGKGFWVYPGHGETFLLDEYDLSKALRITKN